VLISITSVFTISLSQSRHDIHKAIHQLRPSTKQVNLDSLLSYKAFDGSFGLTCLQPTLRPSGEMNGSLFLWPTIISSLTLSFGFQASISVIQHGLC